MAEEFQTGICGGTWWSSSRSSFSPCSAVGIGLATDHMGSFLWSSSDLVDEKTTTRSCEESNNSVSADSSIVFQGAQKPQQTDSDSGGSSGLMDSTLQMMSFGLSSSSASSTDWNQALLRGSGTESYHSIIQEDMSSRLSYRQETGMDISQIQKDWSPKSFASAGEDCSINGFRSISQDFPLDQLQLKSVTSSDTCQGSSAGFSTGSASYMYPLTSLQTLYETQPQQPPFNNRSMSYSSTANYGTNSNQLSPTSWPKFAPGMLKPSLPKQLPSSMHFSNNTPFWNASANALNENKAGFFTSSQSQFLAPALEEKPNCPSNTTKSNKEDVQDPGSMLKKGSSEPAFKRPRIETPSPLPTFKVRKEKLGDRITALQQLVSPFGKTDTASVLHEAIEYIKFLHDQVSVLSTPYMKQGTPIQQSSEKLKDPEAAKQDLRSRGLCLVPISSTFPVTNETPADFWTPTFGGAFR